jgi:hypothetical protein
LQTLQRGSARATFVVGAILSVPGFTYLAALGLIAKQDVSTLGSILLVLTPHPGANSRQRACPHQAGSPRMVPTFIADRSTRAAPSFSPAASP